MHYTHGISKLIIQFVEPVNMDVYAMLFKIKNKRDFDIKLFDENNNDKIYHIDAIEYITPGFINSYNNNILLCEVSCILKSVEVIKNHNHTI